MAHFMTTSEEREICWSPECLLLGNLRRGYRKIISVSCDTSGTVPYYQQWSGLLGLGLGLGLEAKFSGLGLGLSQGAYNSGKPGKHGNLREFVHSGKLGENSGNLKFTQGIYQMLFFCDAICLSGIELCA